MPLVTAALLAYIAGLLAGFGDAVAWTILAAGVVVASSGRGRRDKLALIALVVAGLAAGLATAARDESCIAGLIAQHRFELVIADDAAPGAFVPAVHDCGVRARVAVRSGTAPAGATVSVRGAATRARNGLVIADARLSPARAPNILWRARSALGRGIDRHFGADAPLVRALLVADMADLSPAVRTTFASAGLSHMLSVSGLHVGLIAAAIMLLAQLARLSRGRADVAVVAVTALYVLMIGAPLPAVRSAVMLAATSLSVAAQRPTSAWAVLAVGASAPVFDPRAVLDVGYQLSVAGMVALVATGGLTKRWEFMRARGWRGALARALVTSLAATLLTAPLVAVTFGRLSFVAPLSNLVAVPAMAVLQPMLFLAAVLMPIPEAAQFVADACHPLLAAIDWIATVAARLPGASVPVASGTTGTALAIGTATAVVVACVSRHPGRALVVAAVGATVLVWRPLLPQRGDMTEVHVIDVGQGDAIGIRTTRGRWLLVDAGREWEGGDAGQRTVVPYVAERGGTVEAFVLSHPHADHVGGGASTIRALKPAWYIDPAYAFPGAPYRASLAAARESGTRWRRALPEDSLVVDEVVMTILAPDPAWVDSLRDPNEASTVVLIRVGAVRFLLTGDAEAGEERWLETNAASRLRADVLKVAHHGSSTSSTEGFLDAVRPRLAIVSVGAGNMYHHPSPTVLASLADRGAQTLRTDRAGTVIVRTDGRRLEVEANGERWTVPR